MAGSIQSVLPPEVRILIYTHIWDETYARNAGYSMHPRIYGTPVPSGWSVPALPHVIDKTFVGQSMAAEIVTFYYKSSHSPGYFFNHLSQIDRLLSYDAFDIGKCAAMMLRRLSITLDLDQDCSENRIEETKARLQKLHGIKNREGFNLLFILSGKKARDYQEALKRLFDALVPIVSTFRKEKAEVNYQYRLDNDDDLESDDEEDYSDEKELEKIWKSLASQQT
jgi:hypothetical protein